MLLIYKQSVIKDSNNSPYVASMFVFNCVLTLTIVFFFGTEF